jgi:ADP-ribose pyrophosphatase YjhB (NUDIX family)
MHKKIKIHINDSVIIIGEINSNAKNFTIQKCAPENFSILCQTVLDTNQNIFVPSQNYTKFLKHCSESMKYRIACGGLVQNKKGDFLFIYRRNKWDLPKGKLEKGETLEQCAIREVQEETLIKNVFITNLRCETYHVYLHKNEPVLKHTYWYNMQSDDTEFVPQIQEEIEMVEWKNATQIEKCLENSFQSIADVINVN